MVNTRNTKSALKQIGFRSVTHIFVISASILKTAKRVIFRGLLLDKFSFIPKMQSMQMVVDLEAVLESYKLVGSISPFYRLMLL